MADQLISTAVHDRLPEAQRPRLDQVVAEADILVVDLTNPDCAAVVAQIGEACRTHGFFQVLNHGLPAELMMVMQAVAYEFFRLPSLPAAEKAKLNLADPAKKMRLSTSFNVRKETVHNREIVSRYSRELQELGFRLYGAISESLGLEEEYIKTVHGEHEQHMAVNFYPKSLAPAVAYGLPARTDPNALTILLMNQQVAGLQQVLKEGSWITGNPQPNALVINIGDQLQVRVDEAMRAKDGSPIAVWPKAVREETRIKDISHGGGNLSAVVGLIAASSAIPGIVSGVISPAAAFGFYVVLLAGLSLAMASVRGA